MVANLAPTFLEYREAQPQLTAGARLTVKAAHTHAGTSATSATHLLVAILERPSLRIRDYFKSHGAALEAMADEAMTGLGQPRLKGDPTIELITDTAVALADQAGQLQVDDFYLFLALQLQGDRLTQRLFSEAGFVQTPGLHTPAATSQIGLKPSLHSANADAQPPIHQPGLLPARQIGRARRKLLIQSSSLSPLFLTIFMLGFACLVGLQLATDQGTIRALTVGFVIGTWLTSLCLHEYGHAAAAFMYGDQSVKERGYLSLDLRKYSTSWITFGLPLLFLLIGGIPLPGGRVMINTGVLRTAKSRRRVAMYGPAANLLCLFVLSIPLLAGIDQDTPAGVALAVAALLQAITIVFNLLPIPPLDGWNVLSAGMSPNTRLKAATFGWMPMIALFMAMRAVPGVSSVIYLISFLIAFVFHVDLNSALDGWSMLRLN